MPRRYGELVAFRTPASTLPPMICSCVGADCAARSRSESCDSRRTASTDSSSSATEKKRRNTGGMCSASVAVSSDPVSAPSVPPALMIPNRRLAWSRVKMSVMNAQKTDGTNRLNTAAQT